MKSLFLALLISVQSISGQAFVIDGDTIKVDQTTIRLNGIAAPEMSEPGGRDAKKAMQSIAGGETVICDPDGTYTHGRTVAVCYVDGEDISETLIRQGYARDCPRFSSGRYAKAEAQAKADGSKVASYYQLPGYC